MKKFLNQSDCKISMSVHHCITSLIAHAQFLIFCCEGISVAHKYSSWVDIPKAEYWALCLPIA